MTMNPHTNANDLRKEGAPIAKAGVAANSRRSSITPASLFGAAFILSVALVAKVFYK